MELTKKQDEMEEQRKNQAAELQGAFTKKVDEQAAKDEDERLKMHSELIEDAEAMRDEFTAAMEQHQQKLMEVQGSVEESGVKHEELEKKTDDTVLALADVEKQVSEASGDQLKVIEEKLNTLTKKIETDMEVLREDDVAVEHKVDQLEAKILGSAGIATGGNAAPEGEAAAAAEPQEGELPKAIEKLRDEMVIKMDEQQQTNKASRLELHDEVTKERESAQKKLVKKIDQVEFTAMDACLRAEEEGQTRMDEIEEQVKLEREKAYPYAVHLRSTAYALRIRPIPAQPYLYLP